MKGLVCLMRVLGKREIIPYDKIHAIEDKYGSLALAKDNDNDLIKVHEILNVKDIDTTKKKHHMSKYVKHSYDSFILSLAEQGYSVREIMRKTKHERYTVRLVLKHYNVSTKPMFCYKYDDIYIPTLSCLNKLGIHARTMKEVKHILATKYRDKQIYSIEMRWVNIPLGAKYMLSKTDSIHVKV
jgi:hypothetical protein